MGAGHLVKRFFGSVIPRGPKPEDATWAADQLLPGERELWVQMSRADRRHAAGVARRVERALAAVGSVLGGAEVIDSRYRDFRFTLPDVIADNASSGAYLTGPVAADPHAVDLAMEAVLVEVDGRIADSATGAAVQGHPAEALALAANDLGRRGHAIEPGWVVLTGGMTDAVPAP